MNAQYDLAGELNFLEPQQLRLYVDEFEHLILERADSGVRERVTAARAFPLTAVDRFIVLKDSEDEELGMIQDLSHLDADSRRALAGELERAYFTPVILQVNAIEEEYHIPTWEVDTDRGPRTFVLRSSRRDIRVLSGGRILLRDADGNRYEIPDYRKLDPFSLALVQTQI